MILGGRQAGERNNLQPGDAYLLGNSGFPYLAARISSAAAGASAIAARAVAAAESQRSSAGLNCYAVWTENSNVSSRGQLPNKVSGLTEVATSARSFRPDPLAPEANRCR